MAVHIRGKTDLQDAKYKRTRRDLLHAEYVEGQKGGGVGQPEAGLKVSVLFAIRAHSVDHIPDRLLITASEWLGLCCGVALCITMIASAGILHSCWQPI